MCTCVETIQQTYIGVKRQTEIIAEKSFDIDSFLDKINSVKKQVVSVTNDINDFVELVRQHFVDLNAEDSQMFYKEFVETRAKMFQVYTNLCRSSLYVGMKSAVKEFRSSIDAYSEMCSDLQEFNIKLTKNLEYKELFADLNTIS